MGAKLLVSPRPIRLYYAIEVAERRRQAVAAVLFRHTTQRPQRVLQAFGERHEALATQHNMGMLEARERQPEVIEPVVERFARNRDAEPAHVGEVRQAHPARRVLLSEDHVPVGAVEGSPLDDATLQCPAHPRPNLGVPAAELVEDRHRADAGCGFQYRDDLAFPHAGEWVGTPPLTRLPLLGWQPRIGFDPVSGGSAEPGLRGGDGGRFGLTGLHVQPRLAVGDVLARQVADPSRDEESDAAPGRSGRHTTLIPLGKTRSPGVA